VDALIFELLDMIICMAEFLEVYYHG